MWAYSLNVTPPWEAPGARAPRALDVCCGGGGMSHGLTAAGFNVVAGIDFEQDALEVFARGHPDALPIRGDLYMPELLLPGLRRLGLLDLVTVSSPCQPFSYAGRHDPKDKRIQITFNGLRLATELRPRCILFENVPPFAKHNEGKTLRKAVKILTDAGYEVTHHDAVDSTSFVPQRRRRFILIAFRKGEGVLPDLQGAVARLAEKPIVTLRDTFPHWPKDACYFHQNRGTGKKCIYSLDDVSPPLRKNCGTITRTYRATPGNGDAGKFEDCRTPTIRELGAIAGWPPDAYLPKIRTKVGRVLGNCVVAPVGKFLGELIIGGLRKDAPEHAVAPASHRSSVLRADAPEWKCPPCPPSPPPAVTSQKDGPTIRWSDPTVRWKGGKGRCTGHRTSRSRIPGGIKEGHRYEAAEIGRVARREAKHRARERQRRARERPAVAPRRPLPSAQDLLRAADMAAPGARDSPLPGSTDPEVLRMDAAVRDPEVHRVAMHAAQLRRRERKRLTLLLRERIITDGTLRDLSDPLWSAPPLGAPPYSGNPAAMFGARPWVRQDASHEPTHPCTVSQHWRSWKSLHFFHCLRCQRHTRSLRGDALPLDVIRTAHATGKLPDDDEICLDPDCYANAMLDDIRVGFCPPLEPKPPPTEVPNGPSIWNEWSAMLEYMQKIDKIDCLEPGTWHKDPDAVVSAMHCVVRPADKRAWRATGEAYPVRTVLDLTASGINASMPDWRFRMEGIDSAVKLLGTRRHVRLAKCDVSKFFPSLPLHRDLWDFVVLKDPRVSTRWRGSGPPSDEWRKFQSERDKSDRRGPYRRHTGLPLGFKLAPAFACALSGEIVQFLAALGIKSCMYVDDLLCAADTDAECEKHITTAVSVFAWLGLRCSPEKTEGPASILQYIGYELDCENRTVKIGDARQEELLGLARKLLAADEFGTKDLESAIGKFSFAAGVLRGGRSYLYRMYTALQQALSAGDRTVALTDDVKADARWWATQLEHNPGGSRIWLEDEQLPVITLKGDASGHIGWGYVHDGTLHWSRWSPGVVHQDHMQFKELVALAHACEEHGPSFRNKIVRFGCDNSSVCYAVNRQSSSCPRVMQLLRRIADAQCRYNFEAVAVWVSRRYNDIADLCTRFQALAEFETHLPPGVAVSDRVCVCRTSSPADGAPVYSARLLVRDTPASSRARAPGTTPRSSSSSTSATPWDATHSSMTTTSSAASSSTTSPAWTESGRFAPPLRLPSSSPPGRASPSSTTSPTRPSAATSAFASTASCKASRTGTRTCPPKTSRSASTVLRSSAPTWASTPSMTSSPATPWCSAAGRDSSPRTTPACARPSTPTAAGSPTSPTAEASSRFSSEAASTKASARTRLGSLSSGTASATSAPDTSCASSSSACTSASSPRPTPLARTAAPPPDLGTGVVMSRTSRKRSLALPPLASRATRSSSRSAPASPRSLLKAQSCSKKPSSVPRSAAASPASTRSRASVPVGPPTSSPKACLAGGSASKAVGVPALQPWTSTTAPLRRSAPPSQLLTRTPCSRSQPQGDRFRLPHREGGIEVWQPDLRHVGLRVQGGGCGMECPPLLIKAKSPIFSSTATWGGGTAMDSSCWQHHRHGGIPWDSFSAAAQPNSEFGWVQLS